MINKYTPLGQRTIWEGYKTPLNDANLNSIEERIQNISDYLQQLQDSGGVLGKGTIVGDSLKPISEDTYLSIQDGDINIARFCSSDITLFHNITTEGTIPYVPLLHLHMGDTESDKSYIAFEGKELALLYTDTSNNSIHQKDSTAGVKGFYWSNINTTSKRITLSTVNNPYGAEQDFDIRDYWRGDDTEGKDKGDIITIHNNVKYNLCSRITRIVDEHTIEVDRLPFASLVPKHEHITDCAVYAFVTATYDNHTSYTARNGLCDFGQYAIALGDYCQSLNYSTFSSGRGNIVLGQYGASFGRRNKSGYCSLTAGNKNTILSDSTLSVGEANTSEQFANASILFGTGNINHWSDSNDTSKAGKRSIVGGENNHNYNVDSAVFGTGNTNRGEDALVTGSGNTNNSYCSVVTGSGNTNSGTNSIICGDNNTNKGSGNLTSGNGSTNEGSYSILIGTANSYNNKNTSIIVGENVRNEGWHSAVFGGNNTNASSFSLIVGTNNANPASTGGRVFIAGEGHRATRNYQTLLGIYSKPSTNTLLAVGNGTGDTARSNVFEVLDNNTAKIGGKVIASEEYVNNATKNLATKTYVDNAVKNASTNIGNIIGDTVTCGTNNTNEGSHGAVFGNGNTNGSGTESALIGGHLNTNSKGSREHSGKYNAIFGHDNNSTATDTLIVGNNNGVNDPINCQNGIIGGRNNYAYNHENVLVSGHNNRTSRDNQVLFGGYSNPDKNTLLAIGDGTGDNDRKNAFTVGNDNGYYIMVGETKITEAQLISLLQLI